MEILWVEGENHGIGLDNVKRMLCSQCSVTAGTNQSQWIINGCEKAGRDGKNLGKHRTNNSK